MLVGIFFIEQQFNIVAAHEMIVASVSSVGWREDGLKRVVSDILPQVDRLNVFLQGYKKIPLFLQHPKIIVARGEDYPQALALGACAKFFWADTVQGYHFTIDDDIIYPKNYVEYCIQKIEQYHRKAVVGFHGSILKDGLKSYNERICLCFENGLDDDAHVHILGTGVLAYHTETIRVSMCNVFKRNMADICFGIIAQEQHIPLICIQRLQGYLKSIKELSTHPLSITIQSERSGGCDRFAAIQKYGVWNLY